MQDIISENRAACAAREMVRPETGTQLLKSIANLGMLGYSFYQIVTAPWFRAAGHQHFTLSQDCSLVFALLAVLFLGLTLWRPLLCLMSKLSDGLSAEEIGNLYFALGGVCFCLNLAL
jgi:hypothetical protein